VERYATISWPFAIEAVLFTPSFLFVLWSVHRFNGVYTLLAPLIPFFFSRKAPICIMEEQPPLFLSFFFSFRPLGLKEVGILVMVRLSPQKGA